jgi:hypothetical protein
LITFIKRLFIVVIIVIGWIGMAAPVSQATSNSVYERSLLGVVSKETPLRATWANDAKVLGELYPGQQVIITGRDAAKSWVVVYTQRGYGYLPVSTLNLKGDLSRLDIASGDLPAALVPNDSPPDDPAIYPILPTVSEYTHEIYKRGLSLGSRPAIFTRVGDCMTSDRFQFLGEIGKKKYDLGDYKSLQGVVDFYMKEAPTKKAPNSFLEESIASFTGFNASSVVDAEWTPAGICEPGATPLSCEYDTVKPAIAIIMFGTNDLNTLTPAQFDFYLRLIVSDTLERGIIPLLSTFPGDPYQHNKANRLNHIALQVAHDYDVPIMNLWLAIQKLPGAGLRANSNYLSGAWNIRPTYFTGDTLQYGYTQRNLLTLQSLDIVWREVIQKNIP